MRGYIITSEPAFAHPLREWGSLSRTWAPRGQQPVVKTSGRRKGMELFGAIEFGSGVLDSREAVGYTLSATACPHIVITLFK